MNDLDKFYSSCVHNFTCLKGSLFARLRESSYSSQEDIMYHDEWPARDCVK